MPVSESIPLAHIFQIKATCNDCGRRTVWNRDRIAREQLRRKLATPEELGALFTCKRCRDHKMTGKNIAIRVIPVSEKSLRQDIDRRPLSEITSARCICEDCGHLEYFDKEKLATLPPESTVEHLWLAAFCDPCRQQGSERINMSIVVEPPRVTEKLPARVQWSKKEVFTDDRSDPYPNLPRRLFGQIQEEV